MARYKWQTDDLVIEVVKQNGTALTITDKAVDINAPTMTVRGLEATLSTNNAHISFAEDADIRDVVYYVGLNETEYALATTDYVDDNGGKIDKIKVNGTEQTITNKEVDLTIPTAVSDLTNDSDFQTETEVGTAITTALANSGNAYQTASDVESAINTAVASAYKYKGSVQYLDDLPRSDNTTGDVYDVQATGMNYAWNGSQWDALGQFVDTSVFWTSRAGQTNTLEAMTVAEINAILNPSA